MSEADSTKTHTQTRTHHILFDTQELMLRGAELLDVLRLMVAMSEADSTKHTHHILFHVPQELMLRGAELLDVLRLMVAMSEAGHGLSRKAFDSLRAEVLATYGYEHALTLGALEKAGVCVFVCLCEWIFACACLQRPLHCAVTCDVLLLLAGTLKHITSVKKPRTHRLLESLSWWPQPLLHSQKRP